MKDHSDYENQGKRSDDSQVCPACGAKKLTTHEKEYAFPYGSGAAEVELSAQVPVKVCRDCGFSFTDIAAEEACHDAICRHLGVMTPTQIRALREMLEMTQAEFAAATGLGEATLSRWERGTVIQNQGYDNYLYLLGFDGNRDRLAERSRHPDAAFPTRQAKPVFRNLELTEEVLVRQKSFHLKPCLSSGS